MAYLLTGAQMRAIEALAMTSGEVTGAALMDRAGAAVVQAVAEILPDRTRPAVVFCGPGNNGGDGYVIARRLAAEGRRVKIFALADPATPDARAARSLWDGPVAVFPALGRADLADRPLAIDAIFGTGLVRDLAPATRGVLAMAQEAGCPLIAVDILSGLCADSGRVRSAGGFLDHPATLTVTFGGPKLGHLLDRGGEMSGPLVVADIGLDRWRDDCIRTWDGAIVTEAEASGRLVKDRGHKFAHGHALVLAGGVGRGGAARLAARSALRVGAGLVTLACPPRALSENAGRLDAVMLRAVESGAALHDLLRDRRMSALVLGPGLGLGAREVGLVAEALASRRAAVLDADALTLIAGDDALRQAVHEDCVMTPHGGEFARLFPRIAAQLEAEPAAGAPAVSKVDAVRWAAAEAGCVLLLKGADTVIAAPDGRCAVHGAVRERAAPWLATAGAGDVLAGIIGGCLARGFSPFAAAETAAWLHVEAARTFGPGLIAEDLPEQLAAVFRTLGY